MNQRKYLDRFFVKNDAKDLCKDKIWSFFVFLALSSVICRPVHFFNTSCGLNETAVYFYFEDASLSFTE